MRTLLQYLASAKDCWPREPCCAYGHINIVSSKITSRSVQVMLDSDIAALFELPVRRINEQMKRNPNRFPEDFCFQLTQEEAMSLSRSQFAITMQTKGIKGGRSYLPYVFTEQGIIALAGVMRSGLADKMAVEETAPALVLSRAMPLGRFVSKYGDFESKKAFSLEGYKMFLLNRYLDESYNVPKDSDELSMRIQKNVRRFRDKSGVAVVFALLP